VKRVSVAILALLAMTACGGSSNTSTTAPSTLKDRAFVTNAYSGRMQIVDVTTDTLSDYSFQVGSSPTLMALSPQREITAVSDAGSNSVTIVNNETEAASGSISLPGAAEALVLRDSAVGFAAIRNASVNGVTQPGAVVKLDTSTFVSPDCSNASRQFCLSVPFARGLAVSPDGQKLLVFSEGSDSITILDTLKFPSVQKVVSGFDRPVSAVFSSDGSKAYITNCGPECGGTTASVQVLNTPSDVTQASAGTPVPVSAATTALLSDNTLFVAGSPTAALGAAAGRLTAFDVSSGNPVVSSTIRDVPIGDGYHTRMALGTNNKLFIGARDCTNNLGTATGCLTIFDKSTNAVVIDTARTPSGGATSAVTGIAPIANRNVVYVISGGELRIYDTSTSALTSSQIDIVGQASDVKTIDQ
jgi:DNA-binding beta-propeller fold protein YncE